MNLAKTIEQAERIGRLKRELELQRRLHEIKLSAALRERTDACAAIAAGREHQALRSEQAACVGSHAADYHRGRVYEAGEIERLILALNSEPPDADYARRNPLGGPAAVFDAMAARIRAGEDFYAVLADCGFQVVVKGEVGTQGPEPPEYGRTEDEEIC